MQEKRRQRYLVNARFETELDVVVAAESPEQALDDFRMQLNASIYTAVFNCLSVRVGKPEHYNVSWSDDPARVERTVTPMDEYLASRVPTVKEERAITEVLECSSINDLLGMLQQANSEAKLIKVAKRHRQKASKKKRTEG